MKKIILLSILVLFVVLGYYIYQDYKIYINEENNSILDTIEKKKVNINKWTIYGTSLNIEGNLEIELNSELIDNVKLVLFGKKEKEYDIDYRIENNNLEFSINKNINEGIILDDINIDKYIVLIKITYNLEENNVKYYTLTNKTSYKDGEYYTITREGTNNRINIYFDKQKDINVMKINVKKVELPNNVYDFSIDPGHGGDDSGAYVSKTSESSVVLEYSLLLKKELEDLGYKVFITRNDNESKNMGVFQSYNKDGRVNIIQKAKVKYNLSIHLNSAPTKLKNGGVEIYIPNNINTSFSKNIVDNIVKFTKTTYSPNTTFKVDQGVYYRYFDEDALENSKKDSIKYNYEMYDINENTPYMYILRELGGINTNAYIDGRNTRYGKNLYYNSNIGVESYLLELGYMVNDLDFNNIINNKNSYINAIKESFKIKFKNY